MYDLIIIGGGPAGLTAAVYSIRKRLNVLLLTKDLGGKTNFRLALPWIQDYQVISGLEVVNKFRSELEYLEFARHMEDVVSVGPKNGSFVVATKGGAALEAKSVVVATGARQVRMQVPGEKEFTMKGLCYSALSYAPLFIDRTVIVIGDGDLALRSAAELATVAAHVSIVCTGEEMLATPLGKKLQASDRVTVLKDYQVVEVLGDEYARALRLRDPSGKVAEHKADGFFVEKALTPNSDIVKDTLRLDGRGQIEVDAENRTSVPGIFAAGDVTNNYNEQVLIAIGEGAKAALSAYEYLLPRL